MEAMDRAVLAAIAGDVLSATLVDEVSELFRDFETGASVRKTRGGRHASR
jgi:hypothetical protein